MMKRATMMVALALAICGCANTLVYDENRDNQAKAAVKAVEEAHLTSTVESLGNAFADMAAREEVSAQQVAEQQFEWEMAEVSRHKLNADRSKGDKGNGLETRARLRLKDLGLEDFSDATLTSISQNPDNLRISRDALANKLSSFLGAYAVRFDNCAQVQGASADPKFLERIKPALRQGASGELAGLVANCQEIDSIRQDALKPFVSGKIAKLSGQIKGQETAAQNYEAAKARAEKDLAAAKDAAKTAIANTSPGKSRLEALEKQANNIIGSIDAARQINEVAAAEVFATDKLDTLEAILKKVAGAEPGKDITLTRDEQVTIVALRDVMSLRDEADELFADAGKPRLVPLLAAIDFHKLILEKIDAVRQVDLKRAGLIDDQLQAALDESAALADILQKSTSEKWSNETIAQLDGRLAGTDKMVFYEKLGLYGDVVREARIQQAVLLARSEAALYERNLVDSRYAAAQWDSLLDMIAKVLADYHAAGVKPADVAEFFKALGLVAIGVGVAQ